MTAAPSNPTSPNDATKRAWGVRRTPLHARGEPMVWLTGLALVIALGMIVGLLAIVVVNGSATFWPRPIDRIELRSGAVTMGVPVRDDAYAPGYERMREIEGRIGRGELPPEALTDDGLLRRRMYMTGNRQVLGHGFRWIDLSEIASIERPREALLLEREEWGVWIGRPRAVLFVEEHRVATPPEGEELLLTGERETPLGVRPFEREIVDGAPDERGTVLVRDRFTIAEGAAESWAAFRSLHGAASERREVVQRLKKHDVGWINQRIERQRIRLRQAELDHERGQHRGRSREALDAALARTRADVERAYVELEREYESVREEIARLEALDARWRFVVTDESTGRFAPISQTLATEPMRISQVIRAVPGNDLSFGDKLSVYLSRWWEFVSSEPREANTEGGVFPVIFGTVMMTILLSIVVAPLGVIAALYLREYARQGVVTSVVRIAVNNLAGVPSIVYGVFGLGFFCYTVGRYIDAGPTNPWTPGVWSVGLVGLAALAALAVASQLMSRPTPGKPVESRHKRLASATFVLWFGAAALAATLLATTPHFSGFFRARLPTATFGTKGILWSSLTLALLTLPVVIVATEEAISAVPRTQREGSFACGASKWQTIRRIVLPRAAPGIMTGMILAMARGAGEVAPLMLVGAVKLAPELPFEPHFPFFHLERSFMHLGFHIYDLGFQSPDSDAAKPFVWTTTLLLIVIIAVLNLSAIAFRARLRRRYITGAF